MKAVWKMNKFIKHTLQIVNYAIFMALVWYFSAAPAYRYLEPNQAVVVISVSHSGELLKPCRKVSAEDLAKLAPNMRKPMDCPRERSPIKIEVSMDGEELFNITAQPPGLFADGSVNVYRSVKVTAGQHHFEVKMNDSVHLQGSRFVASQNIKLEPAQQLLIDFNSEDGFVFK